MTMQRLSLPFSIFMISLIFLIGDFRASFANHQSESLTQTLMIIHQVFSTVLWLSGVWLIKRVIDILLWENIFYRRFGFTPPRLLKDMTVALLILVAATGILGGVFKLPMSGIWATSGMVGLVLGLALQHTITDAFSGLAMNLDDSLSLGEWVQINQRGLPTYTGKVIEVNWRTTQILTKDQTTVIFPNSLLSSISIVNLSRPKPISRFKLELTFPKSINTHRVERALQSAMYQTEGILHHYKAPSIRIRNMNQVGIVYQMRYWVDPVEISPSKVRSRLLIQTQKYLEYAQFTVAFPTYVKEADQNAIPIDWSDSRLLLLQRVSLFQNIPHEILMQLAQNLQVRSFNLKQPVVTEGEHTQSMFIVAEGVLEVYTQHEKEYVHICHIFPEDFIGEHSLLTGDPRNACVRAITSTICYEISHPTMLLLLEEYPELVNQLSTALEERLKHRDLIRDQQLNITSDISSNLSMADKIRDFFGI